MKPFAVLALLILAACGADGPPERPTMQAGGTLAGQVEIGITGDN